MKGIFVALEDFKAGDRIIASVKDSTVEGGEDIVRFRKVDSFDFLLCFEIDIDVPKNGVIAHESLRFLS